VDEWLDAVQGGGAGAPGGVGAVGAVGSVGPVGKKLLDIDYDIYAEGEAALGWLNASVRLSAGAAGQPGQLAAADADDGALSACAGALPAADADALPADWAGFCRTLLEGLREDFRRRGARVGHVKMLLSAGSQQCVANLTSTDGEVCLRGHVPKTAHADLVLNARVEMSPEELESLVRGRLSAAAAGGVTAEVIHLQSLRPGRPRPTHRYRSVVEQ